MPELDAASGKARRKTSPGQTFQTYWGSSRTRFPGASGPANPVRPGKFQTSAPWEGNSPARRPRLRPAALPRTKKTLRVADIQDAQSAHVFRQTVVRKLLRPRITPTRGYDSSGKLHPMEPIRLFGNPRLDPIAVRSQTCIHLSSVSLPVSYPWESRKLGLVPHYTFVPLASRSPDSHPHQTHHTNN